MCQFYLQRLGLQRKSCIIHTNTNTYPNKFLATNLIERCAKNKESYETKNVEDKAEETTVFDRLFMTTYTPDLTLTFTEFSLQTTMSFTFYKKNLQYDDKNG